MVTGETARTGFLSCCGVMANPERMAAVADMDSHLAAYAERREAIAAAVRAATAGAAEQAGTVSEALAGREETAVTEQRFAAMSRMPVALGCAGAAATEGPAALVETLGEAAEGTEVAVVTA